MTAFLSCSVVQMARKRVKVLRIQRDRRWKEMWDDATGRAFFYDKNTGEIRWRRPQQLLNLLPKPMCSNCEELYADFECSECTEFYCRTCFPQIHFGGKRKQHKFRCAQAWLLMERCRDCFPGAGLSLRCIDSHTGRCTMRTGTALITVKVSGRLCGPAKSNRTSSAGGTSPPLLLTSLQALATTTPRLLCTKAALPRITRPQPTP